MTRNIFCKTSGGKNKFEDSTADLLKKQTHFSKDEIDRLYNSFRRFTSGGNSSLKSQALSRSTCDDIDKKDGIDRIMFREILHNTFHILTEDVIMDKIFSAFDRRCDGILHVDEWISGLSIFLRGSLEEQISFSFFVYDINSDGVISKDEILSLLRYSLLKLPHDEDPDDCVKDLADITLKKFDYDRDNKISFQDFSQAVQNDNLLLEGLGQCLPTEDACKSFLSSI